MDDRDLDERAVLADDLQQRGDPLGELVALQLAREALPDTAHPMRKKAIENRIATYLDQHHDALFGPLAPHVQRLSLPDLFDPAIDILRWRGGFVEALFVQRRLKDLQLSDAVRMIASVPMFRFAHEITIGMGDLSAAFGELAKLPALRTLAIDQWKRVLPKLEHAFVEFDDNARALLARLEHFNGGSVRYSKFESSSLRSVRMWPSYSEPPPYFDAVLPEARRLELHHFEFDPRLLERYPKIEQLRFSVREIRRDALEALVASPRLAQLTEIELGYLLDDAALGLLARNGDRLQHVTKLVLRGQFSPDAKAAARARLPAIADLA